jgi:hypothetical protein
MQNPTLTEPLDNRPVLKHIVTRRCHGTGLRRGNDQSIVSQRLKSARIQILDGNEWTELTSPS